MSNCKICNDRGYLLTSDGKNALCQCRLRTRWSDYLRQVKSLITSTNKSILIHSPIINSNQVITNTVQNIAGLMKVMLSYWYPEDYTITTLEEINSISFGHHPIYKSLYDFADNYEYFIVDMTIINTMRAKAPGWNSSDSMCLLDFIKAIIPTSQKVVVINSGIAELTKLYPELCIGLNEFGIKYFHKETYQKFPTKNNLKGEHDD